jgi:hypothetical protein
MLIMAGDNLPNPRFETTLCPNPVYYALFDLLNGDTAGTQRNASWYVDIDLRWLSSQSI